MNGLYRMTDFEIATGWPTGREPIPSTAAAPTPSPDPPVEALGAVLRRALERPPCVVAFSGGRDSSALLAIAARVAKAAGLPAPVAATLRHPTTPEAVEDEWQELVVRSLGIREWVRIEVASDDGDLLGEAATRTLRRHGPMWPAAHHALMPLWPLVAAGSLVVGDGGDEVFGEHRITPLTRLRRRRSLGATDRREGLLAIAPWLVRRSVYLDRLRAQLARSWLRPAAQERFAQELAADGADRPLRWEESLRQLPAMRARRWGFHNQDVLAAEAGVTLVRPFHDPEVTSSLGAHAPRWGYPDRDTAMRELFAGLLPVEILTRSTKAVFNRVAFGERSRAFVAEWDGSGVPPDLVDADALRRAWQADAPHALSYPLLQSVWLATVGRRTEAYHPPSPVLS